MSPVAPSRVSAARNARTPDSYEHMTRTAPELRSGTTFVSKPELRSGTTLNSRPELRSGTTFDSKPELRSGTTREAARAARAVVLPDPGGPVTRQMPLGGADTTASSAGVIVETNSARKDALGLDGF